MGLEWFKMWFPGWDVYYSCVYVRTPHLGFEGRLKMVINIRGLFFFCIGLNRKRKMLHHGVVWRE